MILMVNKETEKITILGPPYFERKEVVMQSMAVDVIHDFGVRNVSGV